MHLRIPRPLTTNNVTDMSLVFSSLHPQNNHNGRKCQLRHPIGTTEPKTPPQKSRGLLPTLHLMAHPTINDSMYRSDPIDDLACNSMSFLLYATSPQSSSKTPSTSRRSRAIMQGSGRRQDSTVSCLKVDQRDGLAFWHLLIFLF